MKGRAELDHEVWNRVASIFDRACEVAAAERSTLLDGLCGSDLTVRREVEEMLDAHDGHGALLAERRLSNEGGTFGEELAHGARVDHVHDLFFGLFRFHVFEDQPRCFLVGREGRRSQLVQLFLERGLYLVISVGFGG